MSRLSRGPQAPDGLAVSRTAASVHPHPMTELAYRQTPGPEPHRERRQRILRAHPEITKLFGYDHRPVWRMAGVLAAQLSLAAGLGWVATAVPPWVACTVIVAAAWALGAVLNHYGGVVIHEASHNLCARTETQNRWVAIFANLPKVLPYAMSFRRHHLTHHRDMGVVGIDNDLPLPFERHLIGNGVLRKLGWLFFYPFFGALCRGFLHRPDRWEAMQWAVQMPFNILLFGMLGPWGLAYLALSTWFSAGLHPVAGHFIHEHYLWDEGQETYSYYGPLNRVTENLGYHVEHHDFVAVPGSRLPELHAIAAEFYAPLVSHDSWTAILWRFVFDKRLSHFSRFVREDRRGLHREPITCWAEPS